MNPATDTLPSSTAAPEASLYSRAEQFLLPGLGLGITGDYLLRDGLAGPGLFAWLTLLAAAALGLTRSADAVRRRALAIWSATALTAAAVTVFRGIEALIPMMLLVILACAVATALQASGISLRAARVRDYFVAGFTFPLQLLTWTPRLLQQADLSTVTRNPKLPGVLRGILLAVPLLVLFGALFAAADAGFTRYLTAVTDVVSPEAFQHILLTGIFGWLGMSLLGIGCRRENPATAASVPTGKVKVGAMETHVVLALVSSLFVAFVLLQLGYLFGGSEVIVNTSGLTVAEYARRGFFELVVVGALALGLLLAFDATDCESHVLRRYGAVLVACVLVILASALQRLFLYTEAFGMTVERFSALAVMLWQAFNVVSFAFTVLRGRALGFASALVISGITSLFVLALANPGAVIARINLERAVDAGLPLDTAYLRVLGPDAVPSTLKNFDALTATQQCEVSRNLLDVYPVAPDGSALDDDFGWQRWNFARSVASRAVAERSDALYAAAGLANTQRPLIFTGDIPPC